MEYVRHGAGCCGISHVYVFDGATEADLDAILRRHDTSNDHGTGAGRLLEAVLSERQVNPNFGRNRTMVVEAIWEQGGWAPVLFRKGFRLVSRFNNSNSGQNCYVFHRHPDFMRLIDLPFTTTPENIQEVLEEAPVAPPAADLPLLTAEDIPNLVAGEELAYAYRGQNGAAAVGDGWRYILIRPMIGNRLRVETIPHGGTRVLNVNRFVRANAPAPAPVEPVVPAAPFVVSIFYSAHLRAPVVAGTRLFETEEVLRAVYPRVRDVRRLEILSDGTRREVQL